MSKSYYEKKITKLQHALKYKGSTMTAREREHIRFQISRYRKADAVSAMSLNDIMRTTPLSDARRRRPFRPGAFRY